MSGNLMYFLISNETSIEDAKAAAESELDRMFSNGDLVEGDKGQLVDEEYDDLPVISSITNPVEFTAKIAELTQQRTNEATHYLREAMADAIKHGYGTLDNVPVGELDSTGYSMIGYNLRQAGYIISQVWAPTTILWNADQYEGGVSPALLTEILASGKDYHLVPVIVG